MYTYMYNTLTYTLHGGWIYWSQDMATINIIYSKNKNENIGEEKHWGRTPPKSQVVPSGGTFMVLSSSSLSYGPLFIHMYVL